MTNLFKYSDKSLVFVYFFLFGLSAVMLSFLISTFFSRAKTAVAVGSLTFLGAFFPYYTVNDSSVSMSVSAFGTICYQFLFEENLLYKMNSCLLSLKDIEDLVLSAFSHCFCAWNSKLC